MSRLVYPTAAKLQWDPRMPSGLRDGLVFCGGMEFPSTGYYHDASGYENHGTLTNMDPPTDWVWSAELGRWALVGAASDYVSSPLSSAQTPSHISIAAWIWRNGDGVWGHAIDKSSNLAQTDGYRFTIRNDNKFRFRFASAYNVRREAVSTASVLAGAWYHLVSTFDEANVRLYLNGGLDSTHPLAYSIYHGGLATLFFRHNTDGLIGRIANPLIYNRVLTPSEIQWLADPTHHLRVPWVRKSWAVVETVEETISATIAEAVSAGDTLIASLAAIAATTDGTSLGEAMDATTTGRPTTTDGASLGNAQSAQLTGRAATTDGAELSDTLNAKTTGRADTSDATSLGDTLDASATRPAAISDSASLSDTIAVQATLRRSLVDGVAAGESWAVRFTRSAILAGGSLAGDSFEATVSTVVQAALEEATQAGNLFGASVLALASASDSVSAGVVFQAILTRLVSTAEGASLGDVLDAIRVLHAGASDATVVSDSFAARLLHFVRGPYRVAAGEVYSPGAVAGQAYSAGAVSGEVFTAGSVAGQVR